MNILREQASDLTTVFFGAANIAELQNVIVQRVAERGYAISRQSDDELVIAMRFVYKTAAAVATPHVFGEVRRLNDIVLGMAVPSIVNNIEHHVRYVHSLDALDIMPRGINATMTGAEPLIVRR